ncbi:MAG: hypothetical protein KGJ49_04665 [Alphaproteobacteria bacterium]|nr:hypothetical protein [Alphaproteobacteria bacterium]
MDRRTVLGLGMAAAFAGLSRSALAEDMNAAGALSTDPTEVVSLWPGTPPGGEGVKLTAKIAERSTDTSLYHDRFVADARGALPPRCPRVASAAHAIPPDRRVGNGINYERDRQAKQK